MNGEKKYHCNKTEEKLASKVTLSIKKVKEILDV